MRLSRLQTVFGLLAVLFLIVSVFLWLASQRVESAPKRAYSSSESRAQVMQGAEENGETAEFESNSIVIEAAPLVNLQIPAVGIDVGFSGETWPRESQYCHGSDVCIDPPIMDKAAWYGARALPSLPSSDAVLVYGHSNWNNTDQQVFNDLPAVRQGDEITATTENGTFIYEAVEPRLIPYDEIPTSEFVYGQEPNKIVLVTCNSKEDAGTIVVAYLVHANAV